MHQLIHLDTIMPKAAPAWTPQAHAALIAKFEGFYEASGNIDHLRTLTALRNRTAAEMVAYSVRRGRVHAARSSRNSEVADGELNMWFELARSVVYPITKTDTGYRVTSYIRTVRGEHETWPAFTKADALDKVEQLIKWDLESRFDKGHGDFLEDIAKWSLMGEKKAA